MVTRPSHLVHLRQNTGHHSVPEPLHVADGVFHQLDPRHVRVQQAFGWIFVLILSSASLFLILLIALVNRFATPVLAGLLVVWAIFYAFLAWHGHRWPAVEYRYTSYRVDDFGIEIRRGVYWRVVINVPRSRVQHTDVSQGPIERRYGLGTLVIYTAGTDFAKVELSGLEHGTALAIREHLLPGVSGDAV
jgi:membrane protein YdbS with pleckstrin-like domain